ncbi:MAG TPA: hypothetical protein VF647_22390 [Longimicrobium sp.]|jgi:hypothetical protein
MARHGYDNREYKGIQQNSVRPDWGRPHPLDPNWADGHYHGMREDQGNWQGAYGHYRREHSQELGGWGGYEGRYRQPPGGFNREGWFQDPFDRGPHGAQGRPLNGIRGYDRQMRGDAHDGGVRYDNQHLQQYNRDSLAFRTGRGYDRSYGWAPGAREIARGYDGNYADHLRHRPTQEHSYSGYNRGGFTPGNQPQPGSRASKPNR